MMTRDVFSYADPAAGTGSCGDCGYFDGQGTCQFYSDLNSRASELFQLDESVTPQAGCKAYDESGGGMQRPNEPMADWMTRRAQSVPTPKPTGMETV